MNQSASSSEHPRWHRLLRVAINALEHRAALASLEAGELKRDLALSGALAAAGALTVFLSGVAGLLVVAAAYWDTEYRVRALLVALAVLATCAVGCVAGAWRLLSRMRVLAATREQLKKDKSCLGDLLTD